MRIAVWHDSPPGGAQRSFSELLRRLAARHTLDIYRLGSAEMDATSERAYGLDVEVIPFQPRAHRRFAAYWNDWMSFQQLQEVERTEQALARRIDTGDYDVTLASALRWGHAPALLRYLRTPSVYFCQEPPRRFYEPWCRPEAGPLTLFERGRLLWRWPARTLQENWIRERDLQNVRSAALVLANSQYSRSRIGAVYGRESHVCYLGVDTDRFRPPLEPPPPTGVVSVGALEPHKGFDFVIRALGRISAARRPALTIVGPGGHPRMPEHLQRLADMAGVQLTIRRGVSNEELVRLYQSHALFVFGAYFEPFGLVALEAMACGRPVVAVREGGVPESVVDGQTGHLTPRDEGAFASVVERLLSDGALRAQLSREARNAAVERWSWDGASGRLETYLEGVAAWGRARKGAVVQR